MVDCVTIVVKFSTHINNYGFIKTIPACNLNCRRVSEMIVEFFYENSVRLFDVSNLRRFSMYLTDGIFMHELSVKPKDVWPLNFNRLSTASIYTNLEEK